MQCKNCKAIDQRGHRSQSAASQILQPVNMNQNKMKHCESANMNQTPATMLADPFKNELANMIHKQCTNNQNLEVKMQAAKENQGSSTRPAKQHQQIIRCSHHGLSPLPHGNQSLLTQRCRLQKIQRPLHLQGNMLIRREQLETNKDTNSQKPK